jgi:serine/threonine-protein kinase
MSQTHDRLTAALADRYAIEGELGQGGMTTVYVAQDLKHDRGVDEAQCRSSASSS